MIGPKKKLWGIVWDDSHKKQWNYTRAFSYKEAQEWLKNNIRSSYNKGYKFFLSPWKNGKRYE